MIAHEFNPSEKEVAHRLEEIKKVGEQIWAEAVYEAKALMAKDATLAEPEYFDISDEAKTSIKKTLALSRSILTNPIFIDIKEIISMHPDITNDDCYHRNINVMMKSLIWVDAAKKYEYMTGPSEILEALGVRGSRQIDAKIVRDSMEILGFEYVSNIKARTTGHPFKTGNVSITAYRRLIPRDRGIGWLPDDVIDVEHGE